MAAVHGPGMERAMQATLKYVSAKRIHAFF